MVSKVPVTGTYLFSAHGLPQRNRPFNVQLHRNRLVSSRSPSRSPSCSHDPPSRPLATLSNGKVGQSMPGMSVVLEVVQGDEIRWSQAHCTASHRTKVHMKSSSGNHGIILVPTKYSKISKMKMLLLFTIQYFLKVKQILTRDGRRLRS